MSTIDVSQVLAQMRAMAAQAQAHPPAAPGVQAADGDFAALLTRSLDQVSALQTEAGRLATAMERGEPDVDLAQVMIAVQKASIAFQATTQVRNRLVSAYQDIMNMPI